MKTPFRRPLPLPLPFTGAISVNIRNVPKKQLPLSDQFTSERPVNEDMKTLIIRTRKVQNEEKSGEINVTRVDLSKTVTKSVIQELVNLSEEESFRITKFEVTVRKGDGEETFGMSCGAGLTNTENYEMFLQASEQIQQESGQKSEPQISGVEFLASSEKAESVG